MKLKIPSLSQMTSTTPASQPSSSGSKSALSRIGDMLDSVLGKSKGKDITDEVGPGYKKGGTVKKTGLAKVHKGERVLTKKQAKKYSARKRA